MNPPKLLRLPIRLLALSLLATPAAAETAPSFPASKAKELFAAIDLERPALANLRAKVKAEDWAGATKEWASYLRARTDVFWTIDPRKPLRNPAYRNKEADDAVGGRVIGGLVKVPHVFEDNVFDWTFNATMAKPPFNNEWQWQLNRMSFWSALGRAYRATGDEKYAEAWVKQFRSFADGVPVPSKPMNGGGSPWRTIECGIRTAGSWLESWFSFLLSPSVSDEDLCLVSLLWAQHGKYLSTCFTSGGNWLTMEMRGLYTVGSLFPEFRDATSWRDLAVKKQQAEQAAQFLADGWQYELSTSYHWITVAEILGIPKRAAEMGRLAEMPKDYLGDMERTVDVEVGLMTPDRATPRFNDSWEKNSAKIMAEVTNYFPHRKDFQWVASEGAVGEPPSYTSRAFDYAGFYGMRTGWSRKDHFAAFRAGPIGYGHCQQDKLNLVIYAYGDEVLFSSGGGSYEQSPYRKYATDTYGHNCVIVDGLAQRQQTKDRDANIGRKPVEARWKTTPEFDFVAGVFDQGWGEVDAKIAVHHRRVLFVKPDAWIAADTLVPADDKEHAYEARWHLHPTEVAFDEGTGILATARKEKGNLAVVPLHRAGLNIRHASAQTEPELLGWNVRKDLVPPYVPCTTLLHTRKGTGTQTLLTLFVPLKGGEESPIRSVESIDASTSLVKLADGRSWKIVARADPLSEIGFEETGTEKNRVLRVK